VKEQAMPVAPDSSTRALAIAPGTRIDAILKNTPLDPLDTRILLTHALGLTRVQLITQSERALTAAESQQLSALFQRRMNGEPIAYIVGEREFFGLPFHVSPAVLIPRPETELLVELTLERLPQNGSVLDMGTGSGAIAVAIAHTRPDTRVAAIDLSATALAVARQNAVRNGTSVVFLQSDWYDAVENRRFDVIAANPPYIVKDDVHLSQGDLRFEPIGALTDHADGLSALRTIIDGASQHLAPGGWVLMEHGYDQAAAVRELLRAQGFSDVQSWKDLASIERVTGGKVSLVPV
jgi:release factor glutamine methyltransferase